jgi:FKBP-type peptidyl-prolyl cis-trans isomerase (trigger factor)
MLNEQIRQTIHSLSQLKVPEGRMKTYLEKHQETLKKSAQNRAKFYVITSIYAKKAGLTVGAPAIEQAWERLNSNGQSTERPLEESQRVRLKQMLLEEKVLEAIQKTVQAP